MTDDSIGSPYRGGSSALAIFCSRRICTDELGNGGQQVLRADRAPSNRSWANSHRYWPLFHRAPPWLYRSDLCVGGLGTFSRLTIRIDPGRNCFGTVDPAESMGGRDLAGGI